MGAPDTVNHRHSVLNGRRFKDRVRLKNVVSHLSLDYIHLMPSPRRTLFSISLISFGIMGSERLRNFAHNRTIGSIGGLVGKQIVDSTLELVVMGWIDLWNLHRGCYGSKKKRMLSWLHRTTYAHKLSNGYQSPSHLEHFSRL
ncbi:hypothetical protein PROFUN_07926 [Planoprotostelium fungivorum]|uniref:Uncharacterized protein n=1 Tax=Planoprotostelium fungivorum TaxID=1890364 RepID=A0A2P6NL58_9EUKA|nr:hypothetical protein PROFUN_07926 [Planoprotostelium fungivorum]